MVATHLVGTPFACSPDPACHYKLNILSPQTHLPFPRQRQQLSQRDLPITSKSVWDAVHPLINEQLALLDGSARPAKSSPQSSS
jgi:hypothetical protein